MARDACHITPSPLSLDRLENDLATLSSAAREFLARRHLMRIGAQWRVGRGAPLAVRDPSSTECVAEVPAGDAQDVDMAVTAARTAFESGPWPRLKPHQREELILRLAEAIAANAGPLAEVEAVNSGRLLTNTRLFDADLSVYVLRYFAGFAPRLHGKTVDLSVPYLPDLDFTGYTRREPVGVVAGIVPWNVPLCQAVWKVAPALATGCTIVLKSQMGPLISDLHKGRVLAYVDDARAAGATVLTGGGAPSARGSYVEPTVLTHVTANMRAVREEIFGPVLVAMPFKRQEEAITLANASAYGLGASVWTRDISTVHRFVKAFKVGTVWVNNHNVLDMALPFGGVKDSGIGSELSEEALFSHTRLKSVVLRV